MNPWVIVALVVGLGAAIMAGAIASCQEGRCERPAHTDTPSASTQPTAPSSSGGLGMTYSGRLGLDLGGGLIVTSKGIEFGFGF